MSVRRISPVVIWKRKKGFRSFLLFIWPSPLCLSCWRLLEYYYSWLRQWWLVLIATCWWLIFSFRNWCNMKINIVCLYPSSSSSSKSSYSVFFYLHLHLHHQKYHFQRLEAMVRALDRINLSPNLLPNISLDNKKVQHCYPGLIDGTQIVKSFEGLNICQVLSDWEIESSIRKGQYIFKICIN